jgi:predicted DNA-binding transcriptional regulator YafY
MKHDYDKIITRLTQILSKLYQGEELEVKELCKEFNVSIRTIQRDFKERLIKFPIYYENKRWKMNDDFKLDKTVSIKDTIVLDILEHFSSNLGDSFHTQTSKLLSKLKNRKYSPIFTKLNMEDISDEFDNMIQYEEAILSQNVIKVKYTTSQNTKDIKIKPIKIVNFDGFWYLVALDEDKKVKSYYIKNIKLLKIYKKRFAIPARVETLLDNAISIWFDDDTKPFEVIMQIDNKVIKYFIQKPICKSQEIISSDEDTTTIRVLATSNWEIIPIVKSWIPFIKVLKPTAIDQMVKDEARKFLDK